MEEINKVSITQKQIFKVIIDYRSQFPPTKSPDYDACIRKCRDEFNVDRNSDEWLEFFKSSWMKFHRLKTQHKKLRKHQVKTFKAP